MLGLLFRLAFQNVFRNKLRSTVAALSVAIGVLGVAFAECFIENSLMQLREGNIYSGLGHFQVFKKDYDKYLFKDPVQFLFKEDPNFLNQLKAAGAHTVAQRMRFAGVLTSNERDYAIFAEAGVPSLEAKITDFFEIIEGEYYKDDDSMKILIGEGVAKAMKIKAGDWVTINSRAYSGSVNLLDFQVAGVFRSISEIYDSRGVWFNLKDAQTLMDTQDVHSIVGLLNSVDEVQPFFNKVSNIISAQGLVIKPWDELADFYTKTVDLFNIQLFILEAVIFFMIFLVLNQSLSTSFYERVREIAVMRALGDKKRSIFKLLSLEVLILNFIGVVWGFILIVVVFKIVNINGVYMPPPPNRAVGWTVHFYLTPAIYAKSVVAVFISTAIASLIPIAKILRMPLIRGLTEDT